MTEIDDGGNDLLLAAAEAHARTAPRQHHLKTPDCPPITRFAGPDLPEGSAAEIAHMESCAYCQKLLTMRFRQECPGIADLIRFRVAATPYRAALEAHLDQEQCLRCRAVTGSAWINALAETWRTGASGLQKLVELAKETAIGSSGMIMQPEFASAVQGPSFRITAGDATGSMLATLINERSQAVLYIEARGPGMDGRRAYVDLAGPRGRLTAIVALEQIGKSATGIHRFGPTADLMTGVGDNITLFVGLEPE